MNERIKKEILQRIKNAEADLPDLSDVVKPVYEYYQKQPLNAFVLKIKRILTAELVVFVRLLMGATCFCVTAMDLQ